MRVATQQEREWADVVGAGQSASSNPAIIATRDWVSHGQDVLILGDDGAGKTHLAQQLRELFLDRGTNVLMLSGSRSSRDTALAPFLFHDLVALDQPKHRWVPAEIVRILTPELQGRSNVILIDGVDLLDQESVLVVERLLETTSSRLVGTAGLDLPLDRSGRGSADDDARPVRHLIGQRSPAQVRIAPLGYWGISSLLTWRLSGTPDSALITAITTHSGGNPRVATALVDGGRWAGAIDLVDGVWTQTGPLDGIPLDAVANALTSRLGSDEVDALEALAWAGSITSDDAERLVGTAPLHRLAERGRIALHRGTDGRLVSVSPPALGRALRARTSDFRGAELTDRLRSVLGAASTSTPPLPAPDSATDRLYVSDRAQVDDYWRWATDLASHVEQRVAGEQAEARTRWMADPGIGNAIVYLHTLLSRPDTDAFAEVFADTALRDGDVEAARAEFCLLQLQWLIWSGATDRDIAAFLARCEALVGAHHILLCTYWSVVRAPAEGATLSADLLDACLADQPSGFARAWAANLHCWLLLELGRPARVLELLDGLPDSRHLRHANRYLDAQRADALLMLNRVDEAEHLSRQRLEQAYAELDAVGIRIHSVGLAEALYLKGDLAATWRTISLVLRQGTPGPDNRTYPRLVALGAVVQAQSGNTELAEVLQRELDALDDGHRPLFGTQAEWGRAHLASAEGDPDEADELLWRAGEADLEKGYVAAALRRFSAISAPLSDQRAQRFAHVASSSEAALFDSRARLHTALAAGDPDAVAAALRTAPPGNDLRLTATALHLIDRRRDAAGKAPLSASDRSILVGERVAASLTANPSGRLDGEGRLSDREREVALLARSGLTNREISTRLYLSVRTVENHVYRALRKLGLGSRSDLRDQWNPEAA
ncbi:DNA-binding CsgD family transcriptional regulator/type II secretory pathway predicted ATPase ExeA [Leifsonia sp. 563]|uniref:helix-turn-helix transcriptional regulator n=1 Tax=Leifsonia sp. 563 TaxID=3156412 RepID=UPI0033973358